MCDVGTRGCCVGREVGRYRKMFPTSELAYSGGGELSEGILPGDLGVPVFDTDFGAPPLSPKAPP